MEAKQTVDKMRNIQVDLHYDSMLAVPCVRRVGGIAMLWKANVDLHVQTYSLNHIDARIMTNPSSPGRLTGFYGRLEEHRKHKSWEYLRHLHSRDSLPWICMGDYNIEILLSDEKQGRIPRPLWCMEDFWSALLHCGLIDLSFSGNIFTWRNSRPRSAFIQERLDRACATTGRRDIFPHAKVHHLQVAYSNHDPILITTQADGLADRRKKKPKRFEEKWASHLACEGESKQHGMEWFPRVFLCTICLTR